MFDTHCHLNFKRFRKNLAEVMARAIDAGVSKIVIPGTDVTSSQKAIEIAEKHEGFYAAIGIHPHHAYEIVKRVACNVKREEITKDSRTSIIKESIDEIEKLLFSPKVVAVGEVGMDRHKYEETKYEDYSVDKKFIEIQRDLLRFQIQLAVKYSKSLILHNREAKGELLPIVEAGWDKALEYRSVFHCCEPDLELLDFAKKHKMFIGVDGDVTYDFQKQAFIKAVPLDMLVVETDSPFILPEPLLSQRKYPNEPANIRYTVETVAKIKNISFEKVVENTTKNAKTLFNLESDFAMKSS